MYKISQNVLRTCCLCILFFFLTQSLFSFSDSIYNSNIKSVQIFKKGSELSLPIININSNEVLQVLFDDLSSGAKNYRYKIIHCTYDWNPDELNYNEYINGFESNPIKNRFLSTNTSIAYHHYDFQLPNEDVQFVISGNYYLVVYEENEESKIAFIRKFHIVEPSSLIDFKLIKPQLPKYMQRYQQYILKVQPLIDDISDVKEEIKVFVYKNFDPISSRKITASYFENPILVFDDMDSCIFPGGNEYRNFDIKSVKYQSPRIQSMAFELDTFNVKLYDDDWRIKKPYLSDQDINGKFYIENSRGVNKNTDGEYVKVTFNLPSDYLPDGNIYIYGDLTNRKLDAGSSMNYNFNTKSYTKTILLKQGYYNYMYVFYNKEFSIVDEAFVESNHFETENEYQVLVYYKSSSSRYDRLIGFKSASTQTNNLK